MELDINRLVDRAGLWPARLLWLAGPAAAGPAVGRLLDDRPDGPALAVEVALWTGWFVTLVATLVPSPASLTLTRIAAPATIGATLLTLAVEGAGGATLAAVTWAAVATAVFFLPIHGDRMVNGSAYGSERRMALRPPGYVMVGPVQVAWLAVFASMVGPIALVLGERYVLAAVAAPIGVAAGWGGARILHQLSRRWVVFVPAGFVIRDPMQLVDAILFRRNQVVALGPALADDPEAATGETGERTDLSGAARGLALEVALREPTPITLRVRNEARGMDVSNIVFTPTLPGALLTEARIRGLKIGTAPAPT